MHGSIYFFITQNLKKTQANGKFNDELVNYEQSVKRNQILLLSDQTDQFVIENCLIQFANQDKIVCTIEMFIAKFFLRSSHSPSHGISIETNALLLPDHPILQILETRVGDKMALDFVKKQKQRFAST